MKRNRSILTIFIVTYLLLSQISCHKQEGLESGLTASQQAPKLVFEEVVHDFGEVGPEAKKTIEFKFTNAGSGLLEIGKVETCCGVTAELSKKEYMPGETGAVEIEYRASKYLGSETKSLYVNSNDKAKSKITLTLKAKVVSKVDWEPKSLKLFFAGDSTTCPKITLRSLDGQQFSITAFKSTMNCVTADVDSSVRTTRFVIDPHVNAEKMQEGMRGYIHISLTHPEWDTVSIPFEVVPKYTINPPQIIVLDAEPKQPVKRYVWITSNYGEDFVVESTSSQNNVIKVTSQNKADNGYQFALEVTPPEIQGMQHIFTDVFVIGIRGGEKIEIPCHGFYLIRE